MNIGIGIYVGSAKRSTPENLFDYDTKTVSSDGRGTVTKPGNNVVQYVTNTVGSTQGISIQTFLQAGKSYKVIFDANSDTITGEVRSIGDNANTVVAIETHDLSTSYQRYEYDIAATQQTMRMYFASTNAVVGSIILYRNIRVYEI